MKRVRAIEELYVLLENKIAAVIERDQKKGSLHLTYSSDWRTDNDAYPLSVSMPLSVAQHEHKKVEPFLWGLLPDNANILEQWAKKFKVSASNAFALLSHVGEDCAGAAQFVRSERLNEVLSGKADAKQHLTDAAIASRLRNVRLDYASARPPHDTGQFSLAGAQAKTALLFDNNRWYLPSGRIPTTHILKPPSGDFEGHAENEHLCLNLAGDLGLRSAQSSVRSFANELAIVVTRFDRTRVKSELRRVHQEDFCQALGMPPTRKYQTDQGPKPVDIVNIIRNFSTRPAVDVDRFINALIFNWLIAGTDAHAKNYGLLISSRSQIRLAPLYDLASMLPYTKQPRKLKLAMKVGSKYRIDEVNKHAWEKLAQELRVDKDLLFLRLDNMTAQIADLLATLVARETKEGLNNPIMNELVDLVQKHAKKCRGMLGLSKP